MSLMRNLRTQWGGNALAEALIAQFDRHPALRALFVGATPMDQVAQKIVMLIQAESPDLVRTPPETPGQLLPLLAIAVQSVVLKSLRGESLLQAESLIPPLVRGFIEQQESGAFSPAEQALAERILALYQQWDEAARAQRSARRNMMQYQ